MFLEELVLPLRTDNAAFKAGIALAAASVALLVAGMGLAIKATFKWADELDSIGDVMGVTDKQAAALNFTLRKSGTSTEALTKGMVILEKGLVKADGTLDVTGKRLKDFGINVLDANGKVKDQAALIDEISKKYNEFGTQQERVNFLTETFGKSGAELIDFFDTLAGEGGLDAVTAKVERLGLAIDPNRYEQFNRNLEELKLIGLGLAVSFTEKVMPVIEGFLKLISDPKSINISKILDWADNAIGVYLKGLGDSVNSWVSSGGPEKLTENIVGWIEGIGESETFKSKALIGAQHLLDAVAKAIGEIDWSAIATAMDEKIAEMVSSHDWTASGDAFGTALEGIFDSGTTTGLEGAESKAVPAIGQALNDWLLGAMNLTNWSEVGNRIGTGLSGSVLYALPAIRSSSLSTGQQIITSVVAGFIQSMPLFTGALSTLKVLLNSKLTDIAKEFYARGLGWANQAVQGFEAGKQAILNEIKIIVGQVNAILKKIITSFTLTFGLNLGGLGGGGSSGTTGGSGGRRQNQHRASGGPVIAGQSYNVTEFFRPERFTPSTSGRVDPMENKQTSWEIDYNRLGSIIANQVVKAMNSV